MVPTGWQSSCRGVGTSQVLSKVHQQVAARILEGEPWVLAVELLFSKMRRGFFWLFQHAFLLLGGQDPPKSALCCICSLPLGSRGDHSISPPPHSLFTFHQLRAFLQHRLLLVFAIYLSWQLSVLQRSPPASSCPSFYHTQGISVFHPRCYSNCWRCSSEATLARAICTATTPTSGVFSAKQVTLRVSESSRCSFGAISPSRGFLSQ